ncbi:NAD(P)/FAD-dependent oxidoreductase [Streptosporangium sp. H16]|uniref:NAD(P)/FAD-dependent oxidoreductase n=1 Tax=Streptosporangium sp. H16 TaxID=3444184 RepID=UPI003F7A9733
MRLRKLIRSGEVSVTLVNPRGSVNDRSPLADVAGGTAGPRFVAASPGEVPQEVRVLTGQVTPTAHEARAAEFRPAQGPPRVILYDILVVTTGLSTGGPPILGLAEHTIGCKDGFETVHLRNHVLTQISAACTDDEQVRRRALTFVVVGGGFSGVRALAEMQVLAEEALTDHKTIDLTDLSWTLVEAGADLLPGPREILARRTADVRLGTRLTSAADGVAVLSDGTKLNAGTLVWAAGEPPSSHMAEGGLPVDHGGRLVTTEYLTVAGVADAFAAGEGAVVPDLTRPGEFVVPGARRVVRQARLLGRNLVAYGASGSGRTATPLGFDEVGTSPRVTAAMRAGARLTPSSAAVRRSTTRSPGPNRPLIRPSSTARRI